MSGAKDALMRLAVAWPRDPVRPALQLRELLDYIAETSEEVAPRTVAATEALRNDRLMRKVRS